MDINLARLRVIIENTSTRPEAALAIAQEFNLTIEEGFEILRTPMNHPLVREMFPELNEMFR